MTPEERARRCEEAVDEWDGPQEADARFDVIAPELAGQIRELVNREMPRLQEEVAGRLIHPEQFGVAPEPTPFYGVSPLHPARPAIRVRADTTAMQARFAELNERLDAFEEALQRSPSEVRQVDPARLRIFQALRGEPQPWHEELTRPGPERVYAYRRLTRRQRAKQALRTMMQPRRSDVLDVIALTAVAIIWSIWMQGAFPADAWLGIYGLLVYAVGLHVWLGWRFWRAYQRER